MRAIDSRVFIDEYRLNADLKDPSPEAKLARKMIKKLCKKIDKANGQMKNALNGA